MRRWSISPDPASGSHQATRPTDRLFASGLKTVGAFALLVGLGALVVMDQRFGTLRDAHVPQTIVWYLVAFGGFCAAAVGNERTPVSVPAMWAIAIGARVSLAFTTPTLSDDIYRYLWDGHLVASGVNPYRFAIADPLGDPYEIGARALANNADLSSPYLPVANLAFALVALVTPSMSLAVQVMVMQLVMVVLDLVTAVFLSIALRLVGLPSHRLLLWLWNPLVIVEIAHGAHIDAVMLVLLAAGLVAHLRRNHGTAGPILVALATLTRPVPGFVSIGLFPRWSWRQRLTWMITIGLFCVPFGLGAGFGLGSPSTGTGLFGSARVYSETFRFNSALYQTVESQIDDPEVTRLLAGALFAAAALWTLHRSWTLRHERTLQHARTLEQAPPLRASSPRVGGAGGFSDIAQLRILAVPVVAYCVLAPVFHPWYLLIVVLLGIFWTPTDQEPAHRWLLVAPVAWLTATLVFSYLTYLDPAAHAELVWVRRLQWWPTLALSPIVWIVHRSRGKVSA